MSEINDDILNDELDEEINDNELLAADEDELLLSDEELDVPTETKTEVKEAAGKWVSSDLNSDEQRVLQCEEKNIVSTSSVIQSSLLATEKLKFKPQTESDVSTTEETPNQLISGQNSIIDIQTKNDEVTSTNKEIEENTAADDLKHILHEESQPLQQSDNKNKYSDLREEDLEEKAERRNIKQCAERSDQLELSEDKNHPTKLFHGKKGRNGVGTRQIQFPGIRAPSRCQQPGYQHHPLPNENFNPQIQSQFFSHHPAEFALNPRPSFHHSNLIRLRADYKPAMNFRNQNSNDFTYRGFRPDYRSHMNDSSLINFGTVYPMRSAFRPESNLALQQIRFDSPVRMRMPVPILPNLGPHGNLPYMPSSSQPHLHPAASTTTTNLTIIAQAPEAGPAQGVIPRKVLINPNFKGGVEAIRNKLMKETQFMQTISTHVSHLQSDEELLRQQEEFINKNIMHIEKRRHERSPERHRSRERSYSPMKRDRRESSRERRGVTRGGRKQGENKYFHNRNFPKRMRCENVNRHEENRRNSEEEDEETKSYRLKIEKQKAMREKILRDKEIRRRKAIEGKQNDEKLLDEPPQKLTPVVITGSKIISLKKKSTDVKPHEILKASTVTTQMQHPIQRTIPTAKILPETKHHGPDIAIKDFTATTSAKSMAIIKPALKITKNLQADFIEDGLDDDEILDEDFLLADSPSPPVSPSSVKNIEFDISDKSVACNSNMAFTSNRRVVIKSSKEKGSPEARKGIFDRLETHGEINESAKKKIQRIMIKKTE